VRLDLDAFTPKDIADFGAEGDTAKRDSLRPCSAADPSTIYSIGGDVYRQLRFTQSASPPSASTLARDTGPQQSDGAIGSAKGAGHR
jgi:hypothetical protein